MIQDVRWPAARLATGPVYGSLRRAAPLLLLGLLSACGGSESDGIAGAQADDQRRQALSAPGDRTLAPAASVTACFFENTRYGGRSFCTGTSQASLSSPFNNSISSVQVPAGWKVALYDGASYSGRTVSLTASASNLSGSKFDNLTSSIQVTVPPAVRYWSDPATWGGSKPVAGAAVVIPAGMDVVLDENTAALGPLTIEGSLTFKEAVTAELRAASVVVRGAGALRAGTASAPFTGRATITLTDTSTAADPTGMGMGTRGILVHGGGKLQLFGRAPTLAWTKLAAHAEAGATQLQLAAAPGWSVGDRIVVAPTEWYPQDAWADQSLHDGTATTELRTLSAASGSSVTLDSAVAAFKWGRLQYVTDGGLSLTPGTFTKPHADAVDVIDERAEVGNLTRNIVIQGLADTLWTGQGFGAQVMVMDRASTLQLDAVELRQMGQAGKVGRYPVHWHLLSYAADGSLLGDASGHFVRNSAIWNSRQRCLVIHGTNGVELRNNICYDIKGHAIFLEDAVERRNVIEGNLVLRVRSPIDALIVANHEQRGSAGGCGGAASGFWLTNPDNTVRNNAAADAQGNGFWLSYPKLPVKQSAKVPIRPAHLAHAPFENNTARANGFFGASLECVMKDDAGNTELNKYAPTTTGAVFDYSNGVRFTISGLTLAKNRAGGYLNRTSLPDYRKFVAAGNRERAITGAVDAGTIRFGLIVARSLNDRQAYPTNVDPQLGIASYHSQMDVTDNTFIGFHNRGYVLSSNGWDKSSGTFGTDDYYIRPVEKGFARNPNNRLLNSDPGYRALPPHLQANYTSASNNHWTLAGALWDPQGYFGAAGRYSVLDTPFLRDASCVPLLSQVPAGQANGLSCAGPYYGVNSFWLNRGLPGATGQWGLLERLEVTRLNAADQELGRWFIEQGHTSTFLGHMRHFAALRGDSYVVRFPQFPYASSNKSAPSWVQFSVENLLASGDSVMVAVHFSGTATPSRVFASTNPDYAVFSGTAQDSRLLSAATSRAAVAAGDGGLFWQDKANQLVWLKLTPLPVTAPWATAAPNADPALYRGYYLRIEP
jgi:G8 domain/Peptidase inhibitor family I36